LTLARPPPSPRSAANLQQGLGLPTDTTIAGRRRSSVLSVNVAADAAAVSGAAPLTTGEMLARRRSVVGVESSAGVLVAPASVPGRRGSMFGPASGRRASSLELQQAMAAALEGFTGTAAVGYPRS
jgi:hypothetical protein